MNPNSGGISFSYSSIPPVQNSFDYDLLIPVLIPYDFLLKSVSEQILITAIVINCQIILDLHELNSTNQGYLLKV